MARVNQRRSGIPRYYDPEDWKIVEDREIRGGIFQVLRDERAVSTKVRDGDVCIALGFQVLP